MTPDILLVGQITVDDTVPESPGAWRRRLGGNSLYSTAGARLWCSAERIGMVARVAANLPFDVATLLKETGLSTEGLRDTNAEPIVEWILYEEDGNRQSFPRNLPLRDPAAGVQTLYERYLEHIGSLSASVEDIPKSWLPAAAIHLAPQVEERHAASCRALMNHTGFLSVDPSPHYSRGMSPAELRTLLPGVTAFLPSQAEIEHMGEDHRDWQSVVQEVMAAGFAEVVLKRGSAGCVLAEDGQVTLLPAAQAKPVDLTGAGDAFSGAYAACRAQGMSARPAAQRAVIAAAMVIECSGAEAALTLRPEDAAIRLTEYLQTNE